MTGIKTVGKETMERYKTIYINGKKRLEHVHLWEQENGMHLPEGCVIHHKNGNGRDNRLENLQMMTNAEHVALHRKLRQEGKDVVDPNDPSVITSRMRSSKSQKKYYENNRDTIRVKKHEYAITHREQIAEYNRRYTSEHKEELAEKRKIYRKEHQAELKAYEKERYANNREQLKAKTRAYVEEHHEEVLERARAAYAANPEKFREVARIYREKNPEKVKESLAKYREKNREWTRAKDRVRYAIEKGMSEEEIERRRKEAAEIKRKIDEAQ